MTRSHAVAAIAAGALFLLAACGAGEPSTAAEPRALTGSITTTTPAPTTAPATTAPATTAPATVAPAPVVVAAAPAPTVRRAPATTRTAAPRTTTPKAAAPKPAAPKPAPEPAPKPAPKPAAQPAPAAEPAPVKAAASGCNSNYSPCVPDDPKDVDCRGGSGNGPSYVTGPVRVTGTDVYGLDADDDGIGCE